MIGARIAGLIASQGPMPLAEFMALAAGDYYATRDPFGGGGDFVTAPEISQMFGELLGLWIAQSWHDQGKPARPLLMELGPGRGTLMRDALRAMKLMPEFHDQLAVVLVEASPVLEEAQRAALKDCGVPMRWSRSFAAEGDRPLYLIANEFFDALPIHQYVKTGRGWCERMVTLDAQDGLVFALAPTPLPDSRVPANRDGAPPGGFFEASPMGEALAEEIAHAVARRGGAALIVDYGYAVPGFGETLQAVKGHGFGAVLETPGEADLSAHVDFTALGDAAVRGGASVCGPVEQGAFLQSLGIAHRAGVLGQLVELERLTGPEQMGMLFKALAIVPKAAPTPPGFG
ncbi:MAG: SAM-dependent methyltransferase [Rhizomicrobium sp.]